MPGAAMTAQPVRDLGSRAGTAASPAVRRHAPLLKAAQPLPARMRSRSRRRSDLSTATRTMGGVARRPHSRAIRALPSHPEMPALRSARPQRRHRPRLSRSRACSSTPRCCSAAHSTAAATWSRPPAGERPAAVAAGRRRRGRPSCAPAKASASASSGSSAASRARLTLTPAASTSPACRCRHPSPTSLAELIRTHVEQYLGQVASARSAGPSE
mmetsp:Transcript_41308/g.114831  ORF Transcript_41308/g.114831 Transcript_41308/m.114831 type:complete len:214 (+) Transcript_41308:235-876(+)